MWKNTNYCDIHISYHIYIYIYIVKTWTIVAIRNLYNWSAMREKRSETGPLSSSALSDRKNTRLSLIHHISYQIVIVDFQCQRKFLYISHFMTLSAALWILPKLAHDPSHSLPAMLHDLHRPGSWQFFWSLPAVPGSAKICHLLFRSDQPWRWETSKLIWQKVMSPSKELKSLSCGHLLISACRSFRRFLPWPAVFKWHSAYFATSKHFGKLPDSHPYAVVLSFCGLRTWMCILYSDLFFLFKQMMLLFLGGVSRTGSTLLGITLWSEA